jgi:4-nitrophenyl phosphatase
MSQRFCLGDVRALMIDIDGTLLRGAIPMPGILRFFTFLQARRIAFVVASNNATKTAIEYRSRLASLGVQIKLDQILNAGAATAD